MERSMRTKQWLDRGVYAASALLSRFIRLRKKNKTLIVKKILCIKEDEIGDFIYSIPVYEMLKRQFPEAEIEVLCRPFGVELLKGNPFVQRAISDYRELNGPYHIQVDLRGTPRSTWYAFRNRPVIRLDRGTIRIQQRRTGRHPHESETAWEIVSPLVDEKNKVKEAVIYLQQEDFQASDTFISSHGLSRFVVFHTGARRALKKWPLERVAMVMNRLYADHGLTPVLAGDRTDAEDASALQPHLNFPLTVAAGVLPLRAFAALCARASLFIGNDSGPLHIAVAVGVPSLGLFGPGDPIFHPVAKHSRYIHHLLECNPCDQVHCKHADNPCIRRITTDEVMNKVMELIPV
jgi:ADP-heptose:LPS heptosyltransferase